MSQLALGPCPGDKAARQVKCGHRYIVRLIMSETTIKKCDKCGNNMFVKDYNRQGITTIVTGIILFPITLYFCRGSITPFTQLIVFTILGFSYINKKERYFYYCKTCKTKYDDIFD